MSDASIPSTKICTKCNHEFPLTAEYFYTNRVYKYGFTTRCKQCLSQINHADRINHPDKYKKREIARYKRDSAQRKEKAKVWLHEHPEKAKEYRDRYKAKHPDRLKRFGREYALRNPDKTKEKGRRHAKRYPGKMVLKVSQRRTRKKGLPYSFTAQDWESCLTYFNHCCAVCGRSAGSRHRIVQDHWIAITDPRPGNPGTVRTNIVPLCQGDGGCNNSKSNRDAGEWLAERYSKRDAATILARIATYFDTLRCINEAK